MKKFACVVLLALAVSGCDDEELPTPGRLTASFQTPATNDGALVVMIAGPGVSNVQPSNSFYRVYWKQMSAEEIRAVVIGNLTDGPLFTFDVPDTRRPDRFTAQLVEVASQNDSLRADLGPYQVQVELPGR